MKIQVHVKKKQCKYATIKGKCSYIYLSLYGSWWVLNKDGLFHRLFLKCYNDGFILKINIYNMPEIISFVAIYNFEEKVQCQLKHKQGSTRVFEILSGESWMRCLKTTALADGARGHFVSGATWGEPCMDYTASFFPKLILGNRGAIRATCLQGPKSLEAPASQSGVEVSVLGGLSSWGRVWVSSSCMACNDFMWSWKRQALEENCVVTESLCIWNSLCLLLTLTDWGFPSSSPLPTTLRLGLQPGPPGVKPRHSIERERGS